MNVLAQIAELARAMERQAIALERIATCIESLDKKTSSVTAIDYTPREEVQR